jgi:glycosidase
MAVDTPVSLRNLLIYQVDPRTFGPCGRIAEVIPHLERIRTLGADIVYLMPFYPIGEKLRQGRYGSPYAIRDHRSVHPDLGTIDDVRKLAGEVHRNGMRLMIDIVINHAAHDCVLFDRHPEWMSRTPAGGPARKIEEWVDAVDLDWSHRGVWDEMAAMLEQWVRLGVDGFRCDVAAMVPLQFWIDARPAISRIKPEFIWLAESSSPGGIMRLRTNGFASSSDAELFQAFDICYDYDIHHLLAAYFVGDAELEPWIDALRRQLHSYPANFVKLRFLENHDLERFARLSGNRHRLVNWTALLFFLQGATMIFAGQEYGSTVRMDSGDSIPHLDWEAGDTSLAELVRALAAIKKHLAFAEGVFTIHESGKRGVVFATYRHDGLIFAGIFNLEHRHAAIATGLPDGEYRDLLGGEPVSVSGGSVTLRHEPVIVRIDPPAR